MIEPAQKMKNEVFDAEKNDLLYCPAHHSHDDACTK